MRFLRIVLWMTGGLVLLLATAFLWLWFGDPGVFKPQLERWVTEKTGREFVIDGRLDIDVGRETVIVAEGIRFQNADWSESDDMVDVGYLELRVDTFSLFGKPLTIELIRLDQAEIRLERPAAGNPNWVVSTLPDATPRESRDDDALDVIVRRIDVDDVRIVYDGAERTGPLELRIASLHQQHRDDDFLELALDGQLGDRNFDVRAVAGTWAALQSQRNVEYEFEAQVDAFSLSSKGTIDDLIAPRRPALTFAAGGPDINDLLRVLKLQEGGSGPIDLAGSLRPSDDGPMVLNVEGRLGQMRIDASGSLSDLHSLEQFDLTMQASSPDVSRILALFGFAGAREAPFTIDLDASRQGAMLTIDNAHVEFADATLDLEARLPGFPGVDAGNASLKISGSDFSHFRELLQLPGAADGPFSLGLDLESDETGEETVRIALTSTLASLEAEGRVTNARDFVGSQLNFTLRSDSLARLGKAYGLSRLPDLPMTGRGTIAVADDGIHVSGPVTVDVEGTTLRVEGLVARAPRLEGSHLSFGFDTPDLASAVAYFAEADKVPPLPVDLDGEVSVRGGNLGFRDVRGTLGASSVDVEGILRLAPQLAGSQFTLKSSGPAFEELVAHLPGFDVRPGVYELSGGLAFDEGAIHFKAVELSRPRGDAKADVTIGLSQPEALIDFNVSARGQSVRSVLPSLGDFELDDAPFAVTARGELRGAGLTLAKFDVGVGEANVVARGNIDLKLGGRATDFEFDLNVPSLARLGSLKQRRPRDQRLAMSAKLRGDRDTVKLDNFVARLGDSDVRGSLRLEKGDVPNIRLELYSDSLNLAPLLEEDAAYEAAPKFKDGRLIPDIKVPFDAMAKLNGTVALDIKALQRESLLLTDLGLRAELRDGALYLHDAALKGSAGWFRARAALEPGEGEGKAMLAARGRGLRLGLFEHGSGPTTHTDIDLNIASVGTNLRELAGHSNGVLYLDMRDFTVPDNTFLKRLYGDLLNEILDTINPFAKTETESSVDCAVVPIDISDGQLAINPEALVQTDKIRIVTDASIDLKTEKMEMTFRTTPRKGLTISAGEILNPFVMVVGTLAAPRLAVDAKGTLISGGAAVATGGLSILARATWDRLVRSGNPCETAAEQGQKALQDRFAAFPDPAE